MLAWAAVRLLLVLGADNLKMKAGQVLFIDGKEYGRSVWILIPVLRCGTQMGYTPPHVTLPSVAKVLLLTEKQCYSSVQNAAAPCGLQENQSSQLACFFSSPGLQLLVRVCVCARVLACIFFALLRYS